MADEPIEALGGKTPMQYAKTPYMDKLAELGVTGQMKTVAMVSIPVARSRTWRY